MLTQYITVNQSAHTQQFITVNILNFAVECTATAV